MSDDLFSPTPTTAIGTARPKCRRHVWTKATTPGWEVVNPFCVRCHKRRDDSAVKRGRTNRARGNAQEREWCKRLGFIRVGHHGGIEDGIAANGMFVGQAKSLATGRFPGWMTDELAKLPRSEGRVPILGVLETPGPGNRPRRLVVMEEADFIALHGGDL